MLGPKEHFGVLKNAHWICLGFDFSLTCSETLAEGRSKIRDAKTHQVLSLSLLCPIGKLLPMYILGGCGD